MPNPKPTIGRIVLYRTDGRNGLSYDLPAIITCTRDTHPGDYPDGKKNPLPVPENDTTVHLTVFTPGGFGTSILKPDGKRAVPGNTSTMFIGGEAMVLGSGTYVEWNVPLNVPDDQHYQDVHTRTWRWPVIN